METIYDTPDNFKEIDSQILALDGTDNKSNLGANALLGVSMSIVRAAAKKNQVDLYPIIHEYIFLNKNPYPGSE